MKVEVPMGVRNSKSGNVTTFWRDWSQHENICKSQLEKGRFSEKKVSSVGMPYSLQMLYGNLSEFGYRSSSVTRSRVSAMSDQ